MSDQNPAGPKKGLAINYTVVGDDAVFTLNFSISPKGQGGAAPTSASAPDAGEASYTFDESEQAHMEYFRHQLDSLDTIDEILDEIDLGDNPEDLAAPSE